MPSTFERKHEFLETINPHTRVMMCLEDIQKEYNKQKAQRIDSMLFDLYALTAEERKAIGFVEIV